MERDAAIEIGDYGARENWDEPVGVGSPTIDQAPEDPVTTKKIEEEKQQGNTES